MIAAILGSIFNRFRGGGLQQLAWDFGIGSPRPEEGFAKTLSKILNDIAFAAFFSWYLGLNINIQGFICFGALYAAMAGGRSIGWGTYIDDIINKEVSNRPEVAIIDFLVLRGSNFPRLRNTIALGLRGVIWATSLLVGFIICAFAGADVMQSIFYLPAFGFLMGICYLIPIEICGYFNIKTGRGYGWTVGEVVFGAVLWGSCQFLLGV
jgi:hypothetical protein